MSAVLNTIKEVSDDWDSLYDSHKYVVDQDEDGVNIRYMQIVDDEWEEKEFIHVGFSCAETLFQEIIKCLDQGYFKEED